MRDLRIYLKVKIKSLAAEAKIIRAEERKPRNKAFREGLADHRKSVVRSEARHTLLAYGFLRGKSYSELEAKCHIPPDWKRVETMVAKYGVHYDGNIMSWTEYQKQKNEVLESFKQWKPGWKTKLKTRVKEFLSSSEDSE